MLDPANAHAISRQLDPFWHAHILFTENYVAFCDKVVGEYMHHRPLDHANVPELRLVRRLYDYSAVVIRQIFSIVDDDFWPTKVNDVELICMHKGNQHLYREMQKYRLFEPNLALAA
jgi:hypothetical protein